MDEAEYTGGWGRRDHKGWLFEAAGVLRLGWIGEGFEVVVRLVGVGGLLHLGAHCSDVLVQLPSAQPYQLHYR